MSRENTHYFRHTFRKEPGVVLNRKLDTIPSHISQSSDKSGACNVPQKFTSTFFAQEKMPPDHGGYIGSEDCQLQQ